MERSQGDRPVRQALRGVAWDIFLLGWSDPAVLGTAKAAARWARSRPSWFRLRGWDNLSASLEDTVAGAFVTKHARERMKERGLSRASLQRPERGGKPVLVGNTVCACEFTQRPLHLHVELACQTC